MFRLLREPEPSAHRICQRSFEVDLPMRDDLEVGNRFPNFELPDHEGTQHRLSHLLRGFPGALIFDRGHW